MFGKKMMLILVLFLATSSAFSGPLDQIKGDLNQASQVLKALEGGMTFAQPEQKLAFVEALLKLERVKTQLLALQIPLDPAQELDTILAQGRALRNLMQGYFEAYAGFNRLKKAPVSVLIVSDLGQEIFNRLPFLKNTQPGEHFGVDTDQAVLDQFTQLKALFYELLVRGAQIDRTNSQLFNLANWGQYTTIRSSAAIDDQTPIVSLMDITALQLKQ